MNHLAHVLLAGDDEWLQLGGLLGDFVRGRAESLSLPAPVIAGVRLHRAIDSFTDADADVLAAKALLPPPYRRYAGILLDMWFDHCLARDFSRWSAVPLGAFSEYVRGMLWHHDLLLTPDLRRFRGYMERHGLPAAYADAGVLDQALHGIGQRLRRENPLDSALPLLQRQDAALQLHFERFFPRVRVFAQEWRTAEGDGSALD